MRSSPRSRRPTATPAIELRTRWQQLIGPRHGEGRRGSGVLPLRAAGVVGRGRQPPRTRLRDVDAVVALHEHHALSWPLGGRRRCSPVRPTTTPALFDVRARRTHACRARRPCGRRCSTRGGSELGSARRRARPGDVPGWRCRPPSRRPGSTSSGCTAFLVKAAREAELHTSWIGPCYRRSSDCASASWPRPLPARPPVDPGWRPGWRVPDGARPAGAAAVRWRRHPVCPTSTRGPRRFAALLVDPDNRGPSRTTPLLMRSSPGRRRSTAGAAWAEPERRGGAAVVLGPAAAAAVDARPTATPRPAVAGRRRGVRPRWTIDGAPRLVTIVPRPVPTGRRAPVVELPPGTWRTCSSTACPAVAGPARSSTWPLEAFPAVVLVNG